MGRNRMTAFAALLLCLILPAGVRAQGRGKEIPFPVRKTTILRTEKVTYVVEGRQTIPPGCRISISRGVKIVGRGEEPTLVVEGTLLIHGTRNDNVFIRDLVIEPSTRFGELRLDMVDFRGAGGVRNDKQKPVAGQIVIENAWMQLGAGIDVSMCSGQMLILNSSFGSPVRINGVTVGAIILGLAVTLANVSEQLGTSMFVIESTADWLRNLPYILPSLLLLICMLVSFSIGSSWGTYAVVFPVALPLAFDHDSGPR